MRRGLQLTIVAVAIVAVISISGFLYLTREIAAPSQDVQSSVTQLETNSTSSEKIVFRISSEESQVEYNINEVLNGSDFTVVGVTNEVAGDILVNLSDPSQTEIGEIAINARTFETDEDRRDNSVARFILKSEEDANEFITFVPTSISTLPSSISVGDTLELEITGELTIAGTTSSVSFDGTFTLESADQLVGSAATTINYADFNLSIPDVPFVASVEDSVLLKIDFVANAVSGESAA